MSTIQDPNNYQWNAAIQFGMGLIQDESVFLTISDMELVEDMDTWQSNAEGANKPDHQSLEKLRNICQRVEAIVDKFTNLLQTLCVVMPVRELASHAEPDGGVVYLGKPLCPLFGFPTIDEVVAIFTKKEEDEETVECMPPQQREELMDITSDQSQIRRVSQSLIKNLAS